MSSSNGKDVINRLIVAFAPRMPFHLNDPHYWGSIDILAYDDPWDGIVYAKSDRKDYIPLSTIQRGPRSE